MAFDELQLATAVVRCVDDHSDASDVLFADKVVLYCTGVEIIVHRYQQRCRTYCDRSVYEAVKGSLLGLF